MSTPSPSNTAAAPKPRDPRTFHFLLPDHPRPAPVALQEEWYPGLRSASRRCTSSRLYNSMIDLRMIVIHATAGASTDGAASVMRAGRASFHWLVPDENEPAHGRHVWASAPERRAAWHVRNQCSHPQIWGGRNKINHWSLGVEIVNTQRENDVFSPWQIEATAQIIRYAWAKYPNLKYVAGHAMLDPTRRSDPGAHFPWEQLKALTLAPTSA